MSGPFPLVKLLCVILGGAALAQIPTNPNWENQKGIQGGTLIKNSTSPDGIYALYEFNFWDGDDPESATTRTGIGLAPIDHSKLLYMIDSRTRWMTDKEVPSFLSIHWSPSSKLLATHDSGAKHSKLHLYEIREGKARELQAPDLLQIACSKLGIAQSSVSSSGQDPTKWLSNSVLEVGVRITTRGRTFSTQIPILVSADGIIKAQ